MLFAVRAMPLKGTSTFLWCSMRILWNFLQRTTSEILVNQTLRVRQFDSIQGCLCKSQISSNGVAYLR